MFQAGFFPVSLLPVAFGFYRGFIRVTLDTLPLRFVFVYAVNATDRHVFEAVEGDLTFPRGLTKLTYKSQFKKPPPQPDGHKGSPDFTCGMCSMGWILAIHTNLAAYIQYVPYTV